MPSLPSQDGPCAASPDQLLPISDVSTPPPRSVPPSLHLIPAAPPHNGSVQPVQPFVPATPSGMLYLPNTIPAVTTCIVRVSPLPAVVPYAAQTPDARLYCPWGCRAPPATDPPATSRAACRGEPDTKGNCSIGTYAVFVPRQHLRPHRIQMHVIAHRPQIAITAAVHNQGLVAAAEQMTK